MGTALGRGPAAARTPVPGAVPDAPRALAPGPTPTPEATAAATPRSATDDPAAASHGRAPGREPNEYGLPRDVEAAVEPDTSPTVPVLAGGASTEAP
ncbi:hypothetical protein ACFZCF_20985 [Streptomyces sp. NPDC007945]|uniref:hypothetical protein n=1 Tax=Streptomyces sp. NPDC007945 TaxID=3364797 RepID=UPI0036EEB18F